jgi:chitodextrinase
MRGRIRTVVVLASATVVVAGGIATAVVAGAATAPTLLSQGKPVPASSADPRFPAANTVDGSTTTRWASVANTDPSWIYVDLGASAAITEVKLTWDLSCAVAYSVQTSTDHSTWKSISSTTTGNGGVDDLTVTGSGRYVRVNGTKRCRADATHGYSLDEFQVFGTIGGGGDKTPPTQPGKPAVDSVTSSSVTVHYAASTDNVKVTSYEIDANGTAAGTATGTTGTASGLAADTDYAITVVALDAAGNRSVASASTTAHTAKGGGGGNPFNDPHLVSMFNGTSLSGWTAASSGEWTAQNGVIHGNGTGRGWLYYNTNVGTFRWIFDVRHLPTTKGKDHAPTVLIWGTNSPLRDALSAIQFQPPNGGHWDYRPGKNTGGGSEFKQVAHTKIDNKNWAQCELIGNMTTGVAKMACCPLSSASNSVTCKGAEVLDFMDKTAGRVGLLALQVHNAGLHDDYKNLWIESPVVQSPGQFITT